MRARAPSSAAAVVGVVLLALTVGCAHGPVVARAPDDGDWSVVPGLTVYTQKGEADCGPAALATVLSHWGVPSVAAWRGPHAVRDDGATAGELRDVARRLGFHAYVIQGAFDDLDFELAHARPVLVGVVRTTDAGRRSHFVAVVGREAGGARWLLGDPARGLDVVARDALQAQWEASGFVTLVLAPRDDAPTVRAPEVRAAL
jgi:ABC-type bacteriocin/lantibiotic exporter with double-glycine peptidase domain